jgi:hypothetical protein
MSRAISFHVSSVVVEVYVLGYIGVQTFHQYLQIYGYKEVLQRNDQPVVSRIAVISLPLYFHHRHAQQLIYLNRIVRTASSTGHGRAPLVEECSKLASPLAACQALPRPCAGMPGTNQARPTQHAAASKLEQQDDDLENDAAWSSSSTDTPMNHKPL